MSFWLAVAEAPACPESAPRSLEAVRAFVAELDARLASAGIAVPGGALDAHRRLCAVLEGLEPGRLEAIRRAVAELERALRERADALARLAELKRRVGA